MAMDGVLVGFGLARVSIELAGVSPVIAWSAFGLVVAIEARVVVRFFAGHARTPADGIL